MLTRFKKFIQNNQSDIILIIGIILIALIGFGTGRLTAPNKEPIVIENQGIESIQQSATIYQENEDASTDKLGGAGETQGKFVGSKNSNKYHLPWCSGAKRIKPENQIWFQSEEEARKAGYEPAGNCPGLVP